MNIEFNGMGLFTTHLEWIHPEKCERTYEIIYVTNGIVSLYEGDNSYELKSGDLILLKPNVIHGGNRKSTGNTSFYWVHIFADIPEEMCGLIEHFSGGWLFRELMDYDNSHKRDAEALRILCEHIMLNIRMHKTKNTNKKLTQDIYEWVRINACASLTVKETANYFKYNAEHISRIIKRSYGVSLKHAIDTFLAAKIKDYLVNTNYSVKEIATLCGFSESTAMINFFKYHEKTTPTSFRNKHTAVHMNKK